MTTSTNKMCCMLFLCVTIFISGCCAKTSQVTLLYTTDTHGRLIANDDTIGIDTIAAIKKKIPDSLLVDAGDYLQGNPIANLTKGKDAVTLMKMSGYYAATVGNHEFDFGKKVLEARNAEALAKPNSLHLLCANIFQKDGTPYLTPTVITTMNGLKIGFFGLTTEETAVQTHPRNVEDLVFRDTLAAAEETAALLRGKGCDLVVALTHVGTEDVTTVTSTDIATRVDGIDVIIDGHSHLVVDKTMPNGTTVVSSGAHAKNIGKLTITVDRTGREKIRKENILLSKGDVAGIVPDAEVGKKLAEIQKEQEVILAEVVGKTDVDLIADRLAIRTSETNFGNLCTDALVHMSEADVAIINGGGIRSSIKKGPITKGDIIAAIPFTDAVVTKACTGKQLVEILEYGFRKLPGENGGFPQISGLRVVVDPGKPAGKRITSIARNDGTPLAMHKTYIVAVTDFLAEGGDGYPILSGLPTIRILGSPDIALIAYLQTKGTEGYTGTTPSRILFRNMLKPATRFELPAKKIRLQAKAG